MPETMSLLDLSRQCFMAVGPSRIAACALAILEGDACKTDVGCARYEVARDRVRAAAHMLDHSWAEGLAATQYDMSPNLAESHRAAQSCINRLVKAVDGPAIDLTGLMGDDAEFQEFFFTEVEPLVTTFLEVMTAELAAEHEKRTAAHRAQALQAVQNADTMGRAISLIAVNAAIEAARSGDNGFKIIADEIKSLAAQTQELLGEVGEAMRRA